MEILIAGIVGIIVWQSITLFAFAASNENDEVGLYMGMGLPLILTQLVVALIHKIKWMFFHKRYRYYQFMDTNSYIQLRTGKYAKPADMQCFNFDPSSDHYVVEKTVSNKYRYVPHSDTLTKQDIQFGFAGMSADYLNQFKKN